MSCASISYSTKNKPYAGKLAKHCQNQGFDVWVDWQGIKYGVMLVLLVVLVVGLTAFTGGGDDEPSTSAIHTPSPTPPQTPSPTLTSTPQVSIDYEYIIVKIDDGRVRLEPNLDSTILFELAGGTIIERDSHEQPVAEGSYQWLPVIIENQAGWVRNDIVDILSGEIAHNPDWTPYIHEFDGVEMVLVPAGCFVMGSTDEQLDYAVSTSRAYVENEQPVAELCFEEPFWIDRYEVTNEQYGSAASTCTKYSSDPNQPRICINWFDAQAYCEGRGEGYRLPTEAELEYGARGPDAWVYPWGDDFDGRLVNFCDTNCTFDGVEADETADDGYAYTAPVGSYALGASWVGALDLSGNVWEWTSSLYADYPYDKDDGREALDDTNTIRVIRAGSWYVSDYRTRAAYRNRYYAYDEDYGVGFRCARSR
ncbi:MAG: SUMF1/EgtB/PvdO family nonheme iron enzyme [Anaerolineales bacterium]|nr:SUMF1/EgtB/PvdO family nonheme iron enzyme [Anaerolineales bacterium]